MLAFAVFSFGTLGLHAFPQQASYWLYENVHYDGPETLPSGNADSFSYVSYCPDLIGFWISTAAGMLFGFRGAVTNVKRQRANKALQPSSGGQSTLHNNSTSGTG